MGFFVSHTLQLLKALSGHQKLQSPERRDDKLSKVAEPQRERSINRPRKGKPTGRGVRHAGIEKLDMHDKATSAIQTDQSAKEVHTDHKSIRYASLREVFNY